MRFFHGITRFEREEIRNGPFSLESRSLTAGEQSAVRYNYYYYNTVKKRNAKTGYKRKLILPNTSKSSRSTAIHGGGRSTGSAFNIVKKYYNYWVIKYRKFLRALSDKLFTHTHIHTPVVVNSSIFKTGVYINTCLT